MKPELIKQKTLYIIEKGIRRPPQQNPYGNHKKQCNRHKPKRYPFPLMKIGDSFSIGKAKSSGDGDVRMRSVSTAARLWAKKVGKDWKFSCRKMQDGHIRIWRIK